MDDEITVEMQYIIKTIWRDVKGKYKYQPSDMVRFVRRVLYACETWVCKN